MRDLDQPHARDMAKAGKSLKGKTLKKRAKRQCAKLGDGDVSHVGVRDARQQKR